VRRGAEGSAWFRFNNRFTTVALTFLVFDVELALLLADPAARRSRGSAPGRGLTVFTEILRISRARWRSACAWVARKRRLRVGPPRRGGAGGNDD
jgi:NADH:ubiquinone oxidoreductase subunit 3 (subunit A)